ncbi:MAG TPA: bifunctional phosphoribosylaminoimidazolecarboxamide formyltransferase/IMP cyclohydrolase [Vicinamibacterales bacterium]|nr:bifunctional phosphoribosylaminoimidazolecarboxamide formyltransferase/IMP cyclohydrolase [Vicinamibacterales bacterium]
MRRALLSVSDKTGLIDFAHGLTARGFELVSTGGTARTLTGAGLSVVGVAEITGVPEMMDGRVKTLHPSIHGGILARRAHPADLDAARTHGIGLIDVVCVNLYPFVQTAARPDIAFDDLIEQIDIGGPSLLRAAAKNFHDVLVVVSPTDYTAVLAELDRDDGPTRAFRFDLARRAFAHTGAYDTAIAATLGEVEVEGEQFVRTVEAAALAPVRLTIDAQKLRDLRYGENPHQRAAWYAVDPPAGLGAPRILQGKELSFTNLLDLDAAARIVLEFPEPAACVIKHTNPCGAATGTNIVEAYTRARDADALAAFGGIVGLNRPLDELTARAIVSTFIEAVVTPSVAPAALEILETKANMRVVTADFAALAGAPSHARELRSILGALLLQQRDEVIEARSSFDSAQDRPGLQVVTQRQPTDAEWLAMRFAWRVLAHVKSNAVIFTDAHCTRAIGAGQMSRVDAVRVATMKAAGWDASLSRSLAGTVAASDAFFPFRDGLDAVAAAGATAVIQPGGSVRDAEVIAAADEHGLAMVFTGRRHFKH